jgi:uncharacterized protein DUF3987
MNANNVNQALASSVKGFADDRTQLLRPPVPYISPPLALLPSGIQDYIAMAAESLNVNVSYVLLPLLSALGSAIGNARSIQLKCGFIQPPVIWTGIIGRSGSRKSPALEAACWPVSEHENKLVKLNDQARKRYEKQLCEWEGNRKITRAAKPEPPVLLTCQMDDLTIDVLADRLAMNRRGVLVSKDELSHFFASFDQYRNVKGSDVTRWLSLHTGIRFALDRRTGARSHRIWQPRVSICGGVQPAVLARLLTADFFERGLPTRFLFAAPPTRHDRWSEEVIPERLREALLKTFDALFELQPEFDGNESHPGLMRLDAGAKAEFIAYYDACGDAAAVADEHEEAAWSKLSGYAARLALVGRLTRDAACMIATSYTMRAACELARWFGAEAVRIYATLSETDKQRAVRRLIEFIQGRGGTIGVRDLMQSYGPLKNQKEKAEESLNALVKAGRGKWLNVRPDGVGRPTRKFQLFQLSTSTQFGGTRGENGNSVDVDKAEHEQNTPEKDSEIEAVLTEEMCPVEDKFAQTLLPGEIGDMVI